MLLGEDERQVAKIYKSDFLVRIETKAIVFFWNSVKGARIIGSLLYMYISLYMYNFGLTI